MTTGKGQYENKLCLSKLCLNNCLVEDRGDHCYDRDLWSFVLWGSSSGRGSCSCRRVQYLWSVEDATKRCTRRLVDLWIVYSKTRFSKFFESSPLSQPPPFFLLDHTWWLFRLSPPQNHPEPHFFNSYLAPNIIGVSSRGSAGAGGLLPPGVV